MSQVFGEEIEIGSAQTRDGIPALGSGEAAQLARVVAIGTQSDVVTNTTKRIDRRVEEADGRLAGDLAVQVDASNDCGEGRRRT